MCFLFLSLFIYLFFKQGKFDNAVEILKPARYKVVTIGGSNAQVLMVFISELLWLTQLTVSQRHGNMSPHLDSIQVDRRITPTPSGMSVLLILPPTI